MLAHRNGHTKYDRTMGSGWYGTLAEAGANTSESVICFTCKALLLFAYELSYCYSHACATHNFIAVNWHHVRNHCHYNKYGG